MDPGKELHQLSEVSQTIVPSRNERCVDVEVTLQDSRTFGIPRALTTTLEGAGGSSMYEGLRRSTGSKSSTALSLRDCLSDECQRSYLQVTNDQLFDLLDNESDSTGLWLAVSDVVDATLLGGSAVSLEAPSLVDGLVTRIVQRRSFEVPLLAVLISVAPWVGAWESARALSPGAFAAERHAELQVESSLERLVTFIASSDLPSDEETRCLLFRIVGMCTRDFPTGLGFLESAVEAEASDRALACAVEAWVVAFVRSGKMSAGFVVPVRELVRGKVEVRKRITNAPYCFVGGGVDENRRRIEELLGLTLSERDFSAHWPSELV